MVFGGQNDAIGAEVVNKRFREWDEARFGGYCPVARMPVVVGTVEDVGARFWGKGQASERGLW